MSSSDWSWDCNTPTNSTAADGSMKEPDESPKLHCFTINGGINDVPEPNGVYMIRDLISQKAITLVDGHVTLLRDAGTQGGWHWKFEERSDLYVGFRNTVSGKYLGRDNKGGFCALYGKLDGWESFQLRHRQSGGYNLLGKDRSVMRAMAIIDDESIPTPKLVECMDMEKAARWEFVKVG
ncbi:hypothetical protein F5Y03DRAFT_351162 [Xylaria venustula]|nr:hypothetical protein F5Y03DRAFT_351162 [Xylaria venustula]